jgi:hypothetical protein
VRDVETVFTTFESGLRLKFVANEQLPIDSAMVHVLVKKAGEGSSEFPIPPELYPFDARDTVRGRGRVVVVKKATVNIEMSLERETLFPTLSSTTWVNEGNNNTTKVEVKVTSGSDPLGNQVVELKTETVLPSGGHESHPSFLPSQLGIFRWNGQSGNPLSVVTNSVGQVENLEYQTGEFSVKIKFIAKHIGSGAERSIEKQISIYPLTELRGGSFDVKPIETDIQRKHPRPYWVVEGIDLTLDLIASEYNRLFPEGPRLTITDASLQYGGRYEINGDWTHRSHFYHRIGLDVDLRSKNILDEPYIDSNKNGRYDFGEPFIDRNGNGKRDLNRTRLRDILKGFVPHFELEDPAGNNEHFHLYFWRKR